MGQESSGSTKAGGLAGLAGPIGLGMQVVGAGFNIARAIQQRREQRDAEKTAQEALNQAKSRLEVNRMEGVQVPLDAYEQAMRETTAQQMQSLEGLREADARTLAAGVGRLGAGAADITEKNRQMMEQSILERDKAIATEQSYIDKNLASLSLQESIGASQAAADAQASSAMNLQQGIMGVGNAFNTLAKSQDLYKRQKTTPASSIFGTQAQSNLSSEQINRIVPVNMFGSQAQGQYSPFQFNPSPFQFTPSPFFNLEE
jgi:hypothetical protein